jgi:hypothetical protein
MPRGAFKVHGGLSAPPPPRPRDGGRADFLRPAPVVRYDRITEDDILNNQYIRLNTIYKVVDKNGRLTDFTMQREQFDFFKNMHNLNLILKARQLGMTTVIQLFLLDIALFNPNKSCGVIAHNKEDAEKFFDKKIKLAYDHIPADFRAKYVPTADQDAQGRLKFANGSTISVGTSMRSDTLQYLHVSEFGKMCAKFPDKAAEVVSGALNTVSIGNWITIESTGEGAHGHFYEMCQAAKRKLDGGFDLSPMDYKFFFYPWWSAPEYRLGVHQEPDEAERRYFDELDEQAGIVLRQHQRNWYVAKAREQKERMWREYPSTPDEAFRGIIDGAPLARIMSHLRRRGHVTKVPYSRRHPVTTFWDLGRNDKMVIWFMQAIGHERRFFDYYEDNFLSLDHYAQILHEKGYVYDEHYLPHDAEVVELTRTDAMSRREILESLGVRPIVVVPCIASEEEGVNMTRSNMDNCWFDEQRCAKGIQALENVRYRFDDRLQEYQPNLLRNSSKHGYDAFAQFGHGWRHGRRQSADTGIQNASSDLSRHARAKARGEQKNWRT